MDNVEHLRSDSGHLVLCGDLEVGQECCEIRHFITISKGINGQRDDLAVCGYSNGPREICHLKEGGEIIGQEWSCERWQSQSWTIPLQKKLTPQTQWDPPLPSRKEQIRAPQQKLFWLINSSSVDASRMQSMWVGLCKVCHKPVQIVLQSCVS